MCALLLGMVSHLPAGAFVQLTSPAVKNGLIVNGSGRAITVMPGSLYVNDKLVSLPAAQQIKVPAAPPQTARLDTLYVTKDGAVKLATGPARKKAPEPGAIPADAMALGHVLVPGAAALSDDDILPISRDGSTTFFSDRTKNQKALSKTLAKLKQGQSVKILFWGDSITCGANASSPDLGYAALTEKMIKQKFRDANVTAKNLGVGGSSVNTRLDKIETELNGFQPDVMVVEFVNDLRVPIDDLDRCYAKVNELVQKYNVEVLYVDPFLPSPTLSGLHNFSEVAHVPYYQFVRNKTSQYGWALADAARRWETLDREGERADLLLADGVVHLNDRGHRMLAEEVFKCFR